MNVYEGPFTLVMRTRLLTTTRFVTAPPTDTPPVSYTPLVTTI